MPTPSGFLIGSTTPLLAGGGRTFSRFAPSLRTHLWLLRCRLRLPPLSPLVSSPIRKLKIFKYIFKLQVNLKNIFVLLNNYLKIEVFSSFVSIKWKLLEHGRWFYMKLISYLSKMMVFLHYLLNFEKQKSWAL